jgi:hypothetical protein
MLKTLRFTSLLFTVLCVSCEKKIQFTPRDQEAKLVVDASIENGKKPIVFLTTSLNFFNNISVDKLVNSFVQHATVKISNGEKTHTLREFRVDAGNGYFLYYYSTDSSNGGTSLEGEQGKTYSLQILTDGKEYTATTTIPHLKKKIETLYFEGNVDPKDSTKVILYGIFFDPQGYGDYTRYYTKTNSGPYYPGLNSVFDDQVTDGKKYKVQIEKGVNRNETIDFQEYSFFHKGDTVTVKYCDIDKGVYDFWRTMEYSYSSIGNPFSSPTKVKGNISNGGLGYFGGYAVQYSSIIIPE